MITVWPLSGFSKKCVDEKTSVERSQSRNGNSIVRGILQVTVKFYKQQIKLLFFTFPGQITYYSFNLSIF